MTSYDVVISARNEERTIGAVIDAARRAQGVGEVIVVDDHSTDATREVAIAAGARVVTSRGREDKAQAMATGVAASTSSIIVFFDGDILHVEPHHFEGLADPIIEGPYVLSCGLIDYGIRNRLFLRLPPITGLRAVRRDIFEAIPPEKLRGFQIEIMINEVVARGWMPCTIRVLSGAGHLTKLRKEGLRKGLPQHFRMTIELLDCFRFVPLWTYWSYLKNLDVLCPTEEMKRIPSRNSLSDQTDFIPET
ncbi:MAG TPA: glycosyltransferase [Thermoanaerobaculia bacterium]|nr:glycosyltransferase [Thermoanaerobaculia bacterium]